MMPTVQQMARELGLTSQEVIARLNAMGERVDSNLSPVDEGAAARLRAQHGEDGTGFAGSPDGRASEPAAAVATEEPPSREGEAEPAPVEPVRREQKPAKKRSVAAQIAELPILIALAFGIAILIKVFLVQAFFIPSGSMIPTLQVGDRVLVEKLSTRFGSPEVGDVVVFERSVVTGQGLELPWYDDARNFLRELLGLPTGEEQDYIKRVVGSGGDIVSYRGRPRELTVNGRTIEEPYINRGVDRSSSPITEDNCTTMGLEGADGGCRVPAGSVFVMGDNRDNSQDSRSFGPVKLDEIVGRAFVVIWPLADLGGV